MKYVPPHLRGDSSMPQKNKWEEKEERNGGDSMPQQMNKWEKRVQEVKQRLLAEAPKTATTSRSSEP